MRFFFKFLLVLAALYGGSFWAWECARAEIYRYKDKNGNWYFTDSPQNLPADSQIVTGGTTSKPRDRDLKSRLTERFPPKNRIEAAVLGTVLIQSGAGSGSGFFISTDGYILTNKHVLRGDETQMSETSAKMERYEAQLDDLRRRLNDERTRLENAWQTIEQYRRVIAGQRASDVKRANESKLANEVERVQAWEKSYRQRTAQLRDKQKAFERDKSKFRRTTRSAKFSRSFRIFLRDNHRLEARLVAESKTHDLALLKLDGYRTPQLKPGNPYGLAQGEAVYAAGNPVSLRNSVAAGVFSGFEGQFLKTDAKIYPGNSGGPLLDRNGHVIGINTFKRITHKFEGLGFALSINTALREFDAYLGAGQ